MNKTENEAFCGPVDDDVDSHVVPIDGCSVCIWPGRRRPGIAEFIADLREAREADAVRGVRNESEGRGREIPSDGAMEGFALEDASKIGLCRGLFVGVDKGEQRLSRERLGLFCEVAGEDRVEIDKVEI